MNDSTWLTIYPTWNLTRCHRMIYDHQRESRLPKWARELIAQLRLENQTLRDRVNSLSVPDPTSTVFEVHPVFGSRSLPADTVVEFRSPPEVPKWALTVYQTNEGLSVDGTHGLLVKPRFSNSIQVKMQEPTWKNTPNPAA